MLVPFLNIKNLVVLTHFKEGHLVKWPVEKSNMQMSTCHLHKCQTALG